MKVEELMTSVVQSCTPETNLAAAAMEMWNGDFGALPVVDDRGKVLGMITDRDICIAAATNHRDIASIKVAEVTTGEVRSCAPEMSVRDVLPIFEQARVRRLPVVDADNKLQGILSISDVLLQTTEARDKKGADVSYADVATTFKAICARHTKSAAAGA